MSEKVKSKEKNNNPIITSHGEIIYEIIGSVQKRGGTEQHSLAHVVIPPGKSSLAHYHKVCEESYYILRGAARMVINAQEFTLVPDQACVIHPGERHQIFNTGAEDLEFLAVCAPAWYPEDSFYE